MMNDHKRNFIRRYSDLRFSVLDAIIFTGTRKALAAMIITHTDLLAVRVLLIIQSIQWAITLWFPDMKLNIYGWYFGDYHIIAILWALYSVGMIWFLIDDIRLMTGETVPEKPWTVGIINMTGLILCGLWSLSFLSIGNYPVPSVTMTVAAFWVAIRSPYGHY